MRYVVELKTPVAGMDETHHIESDEARIDEVVQAMAYDNLSQYSHYFPEEIEQLIKDEEIDDEWEATEEFVRTHADWDYSEWNPEVDGPWEG